MISEPGRAAECDLLFVYGTLRRGLRLHHYLQNLGARFQAEASVPADLFDLGSYPGARPVSAEGNRVHGELFQLSDPSHDLAVLDELEEFIPDDPECSEFYREVAEVTLRDGTREHAWIYWLGEIASAGRPRIASGDYAAWLAGKAGN
jgi:gamma-glutamylcyclotransferase (GGCT)/AIG2-like uncharacterized protein YtfP